MFDVMADWLTVPLLNAEAGRPPRRVGLAHPSIAPYGVFRSKEGNDILISIQSEREWRIFCSEVLESPQLPTQPRFATNVARVQNRAETDRIVAEAFAGLPHEQLIERLTRADVAFAEVNDMAGLSRHPHLRRIEVDTAGGRVAYPAPAVLYPGEVRAGAAVPTLGAHTQAVRAEFSVTKQQVPDARDA